MNTSRLTRALLFFEDQARKSFERFPFFHALLAGVGVVLFWRGVWEYSDRLHVHPTWSIGLGIAILIAIGLFLQTFVGNTIIIKKVDTEKKVGQAIKSELKKSKEEAGKEEITLEVLAQRIEALSDKMDSLNDGQS